MLDFEPDDKFLLSGSADETVMVWSLESLYESNPEEVTLPRCNSFTFYPLQLPNFYLLNVIF